ncbi:hypothetical protein NG800_012970 [Epilithonimonas ginsengisoli]|uniref:Uncharacterized protein n=1 Tax=Epilithonimonas ginsengisoli TaxID=1245592 RepID=A0ABU4JJH3_9FLAO|nr:MULTISPECIES: hypothetical protein [Chryseobacterium group]MBV6880941.1 hypothetical protein [Epilithonimonas sp. FP105]MDW8549830.1 hypothetical protein [Epilithonimonas ginsengisoli]OAH73579.1 hypothetical protein AXA65_07525 [Chryseobacterium sp. FP211-J200]
MTGNELFQKLSIRDYSGSDADNYAQLLSTLFFHLSANNEIKQFYELLEIADSRGKLISINDSTNIKDEYFYSDLILK